MRYLLCVPLCLALALPAVRAADKDEPIFEPGAKLKIEAGEGAGGEGPAWHPKLGVLTTGAHGEIMQLDRDGKSHVYRKDAGANGLLFDKEGRLLACESDPGAASCAPSLDGKIVVLADKFDGKRFNEPNDVTVDSKGASTSPIRVMAKRRARTKSTTRATPSRASTASTPTGR